MPMTASPRLFDRLITAWHERLGDTTLRLRVESGRPAAADFVLPVPEK